MKPSGVGAPRKARKAKINVKSRTESRSNGRELKRDWRGRNRAAFAVLKAQGPPKTSPEKYWSPCLWKREILRTPLSIGIFSIST